jgi:hypothetical protein
MLLKQRAHVLTGRLNFPTRFEGVALYVLGRSRQLSTRNTSLPRVGGFDGGYYCFLAPVETVVLVCPLAFMPESNT